MNLLGLQPIYQQKQRKAYIDLLGRDILRQQVGDGFNTYKLQCLAVWPITSQPLWN